MSKRPLHALDAGHRAYAPQPKRANTGNNSASAYHSLPENGRHYLSDLDCHSDLQATNFASALVDAALVRDELDIDHNADHLHFNPPGPLRPMDSQPDVRTANSRIAADAAAVAWLGRVEQRTAEHLAQLIFHRYGPSLARLLPGHPNQSSDREEPLQPYQSQPLVTQDGPDGPDVPRSGQAARSFDHLPQDPYRGQLPSTLPVTGSFSVATTPAAPFFPPSTPSAFSTPSAVSAPMPFIPLPTTDSCSMPPKAHLFSTPTPVLGSNTAPRLTSSVSAPLNALSISTAPPIQDSFLHHPQLTTPFPRAPPAAPPTSSTLSSSHTPTSLRPSPMNTLTPSPSLHRAPPTSNILPTNDTSNDYTALRTKTKNTSVTWWSRFLSIPAHDLQLTQADVSSLRYITFSALSPLRDQLLVANVPRAQNGVGVLLRLVWDPQPNLFVLQIAICIILYIALPPFSSAPPQVLKHATHRDEHPQTWAEQSRSLYQGWKTGAAPRMQSADFFSLFAKYHTFLEDDSLTPVEFEKRVKQCIKYGGCYCYIAWNMGLGTLVQLKEWLGPDPKLMWGCTKGGTRAQASQTINEVIERVKEKAGGTGACPSAAVDGRVGGNTGTTGGRVEEGRETAETLMNDILWTLGGFCEGFESRSSGGAGRFPGFENSGRQDGYVGDGMERLE